MWAPSLIFRRYCAKPYHAWIQRYNCTQFCCYYLICDTAFWSRECPAAPSKLLNVSRRHKEAPQRHRKCRAAVRHSLTSGTPVRPNLLNMRLITMRRYRPTVQNQAIAQYKRQNSLKQLAENRITTVCRTMFFKSFSVGDRSQFISK